MVASLEELASACTDEQWLDAIVEASKQSVVGGVRFPSLPSPVWQSNFVGMSGENAIRDAFRFYQFVRDEYQRLTGKPLDRATRTLDFGCGWGRFLLLFMKDIGHDALFGVDVDPDVVGFCKVSGIPARLATVPAYGPTSFETQSFDLIYAYSVFSHLAEPAHLAWIDEFRRILRPNGVLVITTQARHFVQQVEEMHVKAKDALTPWERTLVTYLKNTDEILASYDGGRFVYVRTGGGAHRDGTFYGEALVPEQFMVSRYPRELELKRFINDKSKSAQAIAVLQATERTT